MVKDDSISRQEAIDAIGNVPDHDDGMVWEALSHAQRDVALLPSAQLEQQWIPCSESLPKPFEYCLFTTTDGEVVYRHWDGMASRYKAWMPLPKPYERKEE